MIKVADGILVKESDTAGRLIMGGLAGALGAGGGLLAARGDPNASATKQLVGAGVGALGGIGGSLLLRELLERSLTLRQLAYAPVGLDYPNASLATGLPMTLGSMVGGGYLASKGVGAAQGYLSDESKTVKASK